MELVDSVDELISSSSVRGVSMPNFEVLDARIASALNKIIHNSQFKRRVSLEEQKAQKEDRFLRGRQIAYLIYDQFRVKLGPDYHRLKTMVQRSIEQEIRNKNFGARSGNFEKNAVVKNQGTKQRVQRILGDCWQWETNGQCAKGDKCSFRHDINKRGKSSPSNPSPNSFMQQNERKPIEDPKSQR